MFNISQDGQLKIVTMQEPRAQALETGWSSFDDWQVISGGECSSDPTEQERDLQPEAFHRQEEETNKEEKVKENIARLGRWSDYAPNNNLLEISLGCGQCKSKYDIRGGRE